MEKVTHSVAPWTVEINPDGDLLVLTEDAHSIYIGNLEGTCGTCHANACLIAAAPEMLKALETIQSIAKDPDHRTQRTQLQMCRFFDELILPTIEPILAQVGE